MYESFGVRNEIKYESDHKPPEPQPCGAVRLCLSVGIAIIRVFDIAFFEDINKYMKYFIGYNVISTVLFFKIPGEPNRIMKRLYLDHYVNL